MPSPTKTKAFYSLKNKRGSQSSLSVDRTGAEIQDVPPELSHLSDDELATPFPHIVFGGYIKYYQMQCFNTEFNDLPQSSSIRLHERRFSLGGSQQDAKKLRRSSSASIILGPLLSHSPKPSPSQEIPAKSHLFSTKRHSYQPSHSSPSSSPSSFSLPRPTSPFSRLKHSLTVIHEASRETMSADANVKLNRRFTLQSKIDDESKNENERANTDEDQNVHVNININTIPIPKIPPRRKLRVTSYPATIITPTTITPTNSQSESNSLTASALALSLSFTPPPRFSSLRRSNSVQSTNSNSNSPSLSPVNSNSISPSPTTPGSLGLRRRKWQLLRTPSVERDFAKCAKDLMSLHDKNNIRDGVNDDRSGGDGTISGGGRIKRERSTSTSSGSELGEDNESLGLPISRTISESTTATSIMEEAEIRGESQKPEQRIVNEEVQISSSSSRKMVPHNTNMKSDLEGQTLEDSESEAESIDSAGLSTPPTSIGCGSYEDKRLSENGRDSWASYATAKSTLEEVSANASIDNGLVA